MECMAVIFCSFFSRSLYFWFLFDSGCNCFSISAPCHDWMREKERYDECTD